ncbi:C4-dicarboxylate ABC transporter [Tistrella bauzanensis]|uniref:TRAP transporter small permease protein n=2 Tax=Tistrella bauzanensis TaxID=657419 RepID=A0ABQ1IXH4_9PROT|nr:C4-dicarboxylate ABC transporter [Tistrella bauzanensis]
MANARIPAVIRVIDASNRLIGRISAWMTLAAVFVSAGNAISRKAFSLSSNGMLELQWYLFATVVMLAAAWTLQRNEHVRIDILSSRFPLRLRHWIDVTCHIVMLLPFTVVMVWLSYPYFARSFAQNEVSLNAGGLLIWPMRAVVLAGFVALALQAIATIIRKIAEGPISEDAP